MTQVRFMVEPLSIYKSGAPIISVEGSATKIQNKIFQFKYNAIES